jgi:molybdopterin molybdotransferase
MERATSDNRSTARPVVLADALERVRAQIPVIREREDVALRDAHGRILAAAVEAPVDLPLYDSSAMDGFAVRSEDLTRGAVPSLRIIGQAAAGHPFNGSISHGEAVRILTGSRLPTGADRVVEQERCMISGGHVYVRSTPAAKDNWRRRGEDIRMGSSVFSMGHRLRGQDVAMVGALGITHVTAFRRLRIGLFSTGDELREPGQALQSGHVWDANRLLLPSLLAPLACDIRDFGILRDHPRQIEEALVAAARDCDLLITTGGMSVGAEDHVRSVICRRGSLEAWPLAIKPGRPVGLGDIDDCPILALPGNPTAAAIAFIAFGRPIVTMMSGARDETPLAFHLPAGFALEKAHGIRQFLLADLASAADGASLAIPISQQSPAMISSLSRARGLIVLPETCTDVAPGQAVMFAPMHHFMS